MEDTHQILKRYWGYDSFRPLQEEIIQAVLAGKDVLALLPTGGGKSICFQVPALAKPGICLVITPLIALMKDQVAQLQKRGITAAALFKGMSYPEIYNMRLILYHHKYNILDRVREIVPAHIFYEKLLSMGIGGFWDADEIAMIQTYIMYLVLDNMPLAIETLEKKTDDEIASFWYFLFDGPHPEYDTFSGWEWQVNKLSPRVAELLKKACTQLLSEKHCEGH